MSRCSGLSLLSGGLDSRLAVKVLERAGAHVEGVVFETPFFSADGAKRAADALGIALHVVDFTDDEIALVKNPPHGFGSAMNPCIDCHATMIRRASEMMANMGFDFVATGEVLAQRPMSQNRQALGIVEKASGCVGRLVRPLSAKLLEPTLPEKEGLLDRDALLDISGRSRTRQLALAAEFGLVDFPSPAGGCKLTEAGFARRLRDLMEHEGLDDRRLVDLITSARRFRLKGGSFLMVGRNAAENDILRRGADVGIMLEPVGISGPTALLSPSASREERLFAAAIVAAYCKNSGGGGEVRVDFSPPGGLSATETLFVNAADRSAIKEVQIC